MTNLAAIGGFNASYLSRLFKKVQNETISDYVLKKRMEAAKVLLQESQEKIQSISTKTGYLSSTSFSRAVPLSVKIGRASCRERVLRLV